MNMLGLVLLLLLAAAPAAAIPLPMEAAYSYDAATQRFTGTGFLVNDGPATLSVNAQFHGPWEGAGAQGAVAGLSHVEGVFENPEAGIWSHVFLIFDLVGSRTGEWWAFVGLQDPLGPQTPDEIFAMSYTDVRAPLHSFLVLDPPRGVDLPPTALLFGVTGVVLILVAAATRVRV